MRAQCAGLLVSPQPKLQPLGIRCERAWLGSERTNSGAALIAQAAWWGVRHVTLLGYDLQRLEGRAHWHADHPAGLGNADGIARWPAQFRAVLPRLAGMHIVNATRSTALDLFPLATLEDALS